MTDRQVPAERARELALGEGIALIRAGHSFRFASERCGIPVSTLHDTWRRLLGPDAPNKDEERRVADERILATAYTVLEKGLDRMNERIEQVDDRTLTAWTAVTRDAVSRIRSWDSKAFGGSDAATGDRLGAVLERLSKAGTVTLKLEPRSRVDEAFDVTPTTPENTPCLDDSDS